MVWACCPKRVLVSKTVHKFSSMAIPWLVYLNGYSKKTVGERGGGGGLRTQNFQGGGVEKKNLETPGVNKKRSGISRHDQEKNNVEFPWVLVFDLGNSNGCDMIWWNFHGRSFILSGISKGKVTKKVCPFSKKYVLTSPCLDFFLE